MSRLVTKILAVALTVGGNFANCGDHFLVCWIVGILWDKSAMRLHCRDAALLGEVRCMFDVSYSFCARLEWNQAYRQRPLVEVPYLLAWASDDQSSRLNVVLHQCPYLVFRRGPTQIRLRRPALLSGLGRGPSP